MRVCVSSTSENLHNFRAAVVQQLGRLGHQVVSMEGYTADARCPVEKCLADVASAEAYIGLFAFRYGSILPVTIAPSPRWNFERRPAASCIA